MPTMSSSWIENQLPSPVSVRKSPKVRDDPGGGGITKSPEEAFGNLSNQSNVSGGKPSVPRRIGDIFRNRLKLAGAAALRSFSTSLPQECNMRSDVESSVEVVPSPRTPKHGSKVKPRDFTSLDAVVIDERPGGRTSTLIGSAGGGGGAA
ncbi:hypothetical protein AND_010617 [Anopheles darlingi]|uniref:Uncharacterized protein n=1 Tax=Anopheles darlingi TaxID=43151 RepID=W5J3A8_ANODA|nr:hypothetical protein AND_010617 [Anopheles darlingi]